MTTETIYSVRK